MGMARLPLECPDNILLSELVVSTNALKFVPLTGTVIRARNKVRRTAESIAIGMHEPVSFFVFLW